MKVCNEAGLRQIGAWAGTHCGRGAMLDARAFRRWRVLLELQAFQVNAGLSGGDALDPANAFQGVGQLRHALHA